MYGGHTYSSNVLLYLHGEDTYFANILCVCVSVSVWVCILLYFIVIQLYGGNTPALPLIYHLRAPNLGNYTYKNKTSGWKKAEYFGKYFVQQGRIARRVCGRRAIIKLV